MPYRPTAYTAARRVERDRRVLHAAKRCIARYGLAGTRVHHVLDGASCSTGAFYEALGSTEAAVRRLADEVVKDLGARIDALRIGRPLDRGVDPRVLFGQGIRGVFEVFAADRERAAVVLGEANGPRGRSTQRYVLGGLARFTERQIEWGSEVGLLRPVDPTVAAWCVVGAITSQVVRWVVLREISRERLLANAAGVAEFLWSALGAVERPGRGRRGLSAAARVFSVSRGRR